MVNINEAPKPFLALQEAKEWHLFQKRIQAFSSLDQSDIEFAYGLSQAAHRGDFRKSGERYFTHPRETAIILLNVGITDKSIICSALLHDVWEDVPNYLQERYVSREGKKASNFQIIGRTIGYDVAKILEDLSQQESYPDKVENDALYHETVETSSVKSIMVKMADRLHNVSTLGSMPRDKQLAKIIETREKYMPIFRRALEEYPESARSLINQLETELRKLERRHLYRLIFQTEYISDITRSQMQNKP